MEPINSVMASLEVHSPLVSVWSVHQGESDTRRNRPFWYHHDDIFSGPNEILFYFIFFMEADHTCLR